MKRKYQPSNGTEGCAFVETYCENCLHEKFIHTQDHNDKKCEIFTLTLILDVKDDEYPSEWTYDKDDKPICTNWQKWDWNNDDDDLNEPPEPPTDDPNQLMLFSVADEILNNHKVKQLF